MQGNECSVSSDSIVMNAISQVWRVQRSGCNYDKVWECHKKWECHKVWESEHIEKAREGIDSPRRMRNN